MPPDAGVTTLRGVVLAVNTGLSFWQTFWVACIPLVGVVVTLAINGTLTRAEAKRERVHEQAIERDRLLRGERLTLYRRLTAGADRALAARTYADIEWDEFWRSERDRARFEWQSGPYAEARLIASRSVIDTAIAIDTRLDTSAMDALRAYSKAKQLPVTDSTDEGRKAALDRMGTDRIEDSRLLYNLVTACRVDLAALGVELGE